MADSASGIAYPTAESPKTVAAALGEIVWLMSRSPTHQHFAIADLEWLIMPALLLKQCRIFWDIEENGEVEMWARTGGLTAHCQSARCPRNFAKDLLTFLTHGASPRPSRAGHGKGSTWHEKMDMTNSF